MNLIKKVVNFLTPTKIQKINALLEIVDGIEVKENFIKIHTSKNLAFLNDGTTVVFNSGYIVHQGKEIHLNPGIDTNGSYIEDMDVISAHSKKIARENAIAAGIDIDALYNEKKPCGCKDK